MNLLLVACSFLAMAPVDEALKAGDTAPPIAVQEWINLRDRAQPSLESLRGQIVLIEFWGTWCSPCVKAMPHIQEIHERYAKRGVIVLAISNEPATVIRRYLERHDYSMIVGADPDLRTIEPYEVNVWPTTYLLDRKGKIAWKGGPTSVEAALDRLLDLPSTPGALLDAFLGADGDEPARKDALERLAQRAPSSFDVKAWASKRMLDWTTVDAQGTPIAPPGGDDVERLRAIASGDEESFDLARWARKLLRERYPLQPEELKLLLAEDRHGDLADAIALRDFSPETLALARGDEGFVAYCRSRADLHREWARKGLMTQHWVFGKEKLKGKLPEGLVRAFNDIGITSIENGHSKQVPTNPDGSVDQEALKKLDKRLVGVGFSGVMVSEDGVSAFVELNLSRAIIMDAIANSDVITSSVLPDRVSQAKESILNDLRTEYGQPLPN